MLKKLLEEWLFFLSLLFLILSSLFLKRIPNFSWEDFKILFSLFLFLAIINSLEKNNVIGYLALKLREGKFLPFKLVVATFFLSMFVTNDVALMVTVPLTLELNLSNVGLLVALESLTANSGSVLLPFGNPQNLFIYYHYHVNLKEFLLTIFPLWFCSFLFLFFLLISFSKLFSVEKSFLSSNKVELKDNWWLSVFLFILFILIVLRVLPFYFSLVPFIYYLLFDFNSFKVDYYLLGTFFSFFGFTDNLVSVFHFIVNNSTKVFLYSALLSQLLSNVPTSLIFGDFTGNWKALLWGVSVGGYGTLIASLANLIAYRFLTKKERNNFKNLLLFHLLGFLFFLFGIAIFFLQNFKGGGIWKG